MKEIVHLAPIGQAYALAPTEERIRRIRADRWLGYPRAAAALTALEDLMTHPQRVRMPNMVLVGATNNGKSMIVEKFCRQYISCSDDTTPSAPELPVLKVQMPDAPDVNRFYAALAGSLGVPCQLSSRVSCRPDALMELFRAARVRLLIIDEMHNLLAGQRLQQRRFLNLIRWLGNELRISIVAVGTVEALRAVQSDEQLANRFTPFALPPWQMGEEYLMLLNTLESVLPLRRPSLLSQPALAQRILALAEGVLGEIVTIVCGAAVLALQSGEECINAHTLGQLSYQSPSQRRHATASLLSH